MSLVAWNDVSFHSLWFLVSNKLGTGNVSLFSSSDQQITVQFDVASSEVFITVVYANVLSFSRRKLWDELYGISSICSNSWFVLGDFNACFCAHEKIGHPPSRHSYSEFLSSMSSCGLTCLDTKGPLFT